MGQRMYFYISAVIFAMVGLAHFIRAVYQIPIIAGEWTIPMGFSWIGAVVALTLCVWGFSLPRK